MQRRGSGLSGICECNPSRDLLFPSNLIMSVIPHQSQAVTFPQDNDSWVLSCLFRGSFGGPGPALDRGQWHLGWRRPMPAGHLEATPFPPLGILEVNP